MPSVTERTTELLSLASGGRVVSLRVELPDRPVAVDRVEQFRGGQSNPTYLVTTPVRLARAAAAG
mgnify:CR=1 FL=1